MEASVNLLDLLGKVLVSTTNMDDEKFHESLIFVCAHDEEGSIGVKFNEILEKKKTKDIEEEYNIKLPFSKEKEINIFDGGPIENDGLFVLYANKKFGNIDSQQITFFTDIEKFFNDHKPDSKSKFLLCKGFCGWDIGQLEEELEENAWITVDIELNDIFCNNPKNKWRELYKKLGISKPDEIVPYSGHA